MRLAPPRSRYDFFSPVEETQVPMFKGLGTPAKDKRHVVLEDGHVPPNDVLSQEVLDWLDRYLGPSGLSDPGGAREIRGTVASTAPGSGLRVLLPVRQD